MPGATPGIHVFDTIHEQDSPQARLYNQDLRWLEPRRAATPSRLPCPAVTSSSYILRSEGQQQ
ncbi:hypothetical protein ACVWW1_003842 [Bradyrhizobium sp. JR3.5]